MKYEVIVFPTDTVYGIGTSIYNQKGIDRIYEIKARSIDKKIPVLCSSLNDLKDIIEIDERLIKITDNFWPGALTIIVKTTEKHEEITGEKTLAVRSPNHNELLDLLKKEGPMRVTSLNISGEPPLVNKQLVYEKYSHVVDYIYNFELNFSAVSSTIIDATGTDLKVLRQGELLLEDILKTIS